MAGNSQDAIQKILRILETSLEYMQGQNDFIAIARWHLSFLLVCLMGREWSFLECVFHVVS